MQVIRTSEWCSPHLLSRERLTVKAAFQRDSADNIGNGNLYETSPSLLPVMAILARMEISIVFGLNVQESFCTASGPCTFTCMVEMHVKASLRASGLRTYLFVVECLAMRTNLISGRTRFLRDSIATFAWRLKNKKFRCQRIAYMGCQTYAYMWLYPTYFVIVSEMFVEFP